MYQHSLKRILDFLLALCGLLVLWPVFLIIAIAIKIDDPGPVFFRRSGWGSINGIFNSINFAA